MRVGAGGSVAEENRLLRRMFLVCGIGYLLVYAFEGAVRYALELAGASNAIFVRDGLLWVPVLALLVVQAARLRVHPAFFVFAAIIAVHGSLMYENMHSAEAVAYGTKVLMGCLFGFLAGELLTVPGPRTTRFLGWLLLVSLVGLVLDKFVLSFPWEGMTAHIGGLTVDVSRDWETGNGMAKRVAGFTRMSISAAVLIPVLVLILAPRIRSWFFRLAVILAGMAAVFFTTQKGALVALFVPGCVLLAPRSWRYPVLAVAGVGFAVVDVLLPVLTSGMVLGDNGGVFSTASLGMRIMGTWPDAWQWIHLQQIFPLGVGLGGIGGAQRLYAINYANPGDNLFIFLYAWFGVLGLVYLAWVAALPWRVPTDLRQRVLPALSILVYLLGYGTVVVLVEDPLSALYIGATAGTLWAAAQTRRARGWADAFDPGPSLMLPTPVAELPAAHAPAPHMPAQARRAA